MADIIIDGNAACGMGAVFAGVTVVAWYPITPSTSVVEATADLLKKFRVTPEGKPTLCGGAGRGRTGRDRHGAGRGLVTMTFAPAAASWIGDGASDAASGAGD